jgi:hypothetical protein
VAGAKVSAANTIPATNHPWFIETILLFMWTPFSLSRRDQQ